MGFDCVVVDNDSTDGDGKSFNLEDFEQMEAVKGKQLSSMAELDRVTNRKICSECGRKRMYFCYDCRRYMDDIERLAPKVELPIEVVIIKHQLERNGKSTATHCYLIAPNSTRICDKFVDVPNYSADDLGCNTVILYPSPKALSIDDYVHREGPIRRLILLDATWFTVKKLKNLPQLKGIQTVVLKSYKTQYWRPQKGYSDECLATIEAIYYAVRENSEATKKWEQHIKNPPSSHDKTQENYDYDPIVSINSGDNCISKNANETVNNDDGDDGREGGCGCEQFDNLLFWFYFFRSKVHPEKRKNIRLTNAEA